MAELVGLDHVQLAMPAGGEAAARAFYGGLLGLREVPKPAALAVRGGCWFTGARGGPAIAIHLGVDADFRPAGKAHPALVVDDLAALRGTLATAGVTIVEDDAGLGVQRFHAFDPFGNRLEFVDRADAGFTDPGHR